MMGIIDNFGFGGVRNNDIDAVMKQDIALRIIFLWKFIYLRLILTEDFSLRI